jgi:hypothetical protein
MNIGASKLRPHAFLAPKRANMPLHNRACSHFGTRYKNARFKRRKQQHWKAQNWEDHASDMIDKVMGALSHTNEGLRRGPPSLLRVLDSSALNICFTLS